MPEGELLQGAENVQRLSDGLKIVPIENVRARIAYALLWIFGLTVGASFFGILSGWVSSTDLRDFMTPITTAEVGLLGSATGFYFGSTTANQKALTPDGVTAW